MKVLSNGQLSFAWQKTIGYNKSSVPPSVVANGVVYFASGAASTLGAFDATTGASLWSSGTLLTGGIFQAPVVANGQVYVGTWSKQFVCFAP